MRGRFNSFQRMMLNWEDLHPYNAVHAVELRRPADPQALRDAARAVLQSVGVAAVEIDPTGRFFEYREPGSPAEFTTYEAVSDPQADLTREITTQLNRSFGSEVHCPFRFFLISGNAGCAWFGLTYHHVVADARAVAVLLRLILEEAGQLESTESGPRLSLYHPLLRRLFRRELGLRRAPILIAECLRDHHRFRRCHLPPPGDDDDPSVRFQIHALDHPVRAAREAAHRLEATVQELLLAALFEGLALLHPETSRPHPRRRMLAVAAAIDLRSALGQEMATAMGQFVSSYSVHHRVPDGVPFPRLVSEVVAQTRRIKKRKLYFSQSWSLAFLGRLWPHLDARQKQRSGRKYSPLMAGISNLDLSDLLSGNGVGRYVRAASTGPVMPLLLDVTSVGDNLSVTTIHRKGAFAEGQVRALVDRVRTRLSGSEPGGAS